MQNSFLKTTALLAVMSLGLAACGDSSEADKAQDAANDAAKDAGGDASEAAGTMMEQAKEVVADVAEAIKLDTSSAAAFKDSLASMKASLSDADQGKLTNALASLGKKAVAESDGGILGTVKSVAGGGAEDAILSKFGDQLNGMSFEDLLAFAG